MTHADQHILRSDAFPTQLRNLRSRPEILWCLGNIDLLELPMVSVVGSRKVSQEGIVRTQRITRALVSQGICVVSGLAEGVDAAAHLTALREHGSTVAVMGTPIDECYPVTHLGLKKDIQIHGLVLSQFEPNSEVQRGNFPRRNELMASLSIMTIVVEADVNSGTRHQVKAAIDLGRAVGFLPLLAGSGFPWVEEAMSSGRAFVINSPKDLIKRLEILRGQNAESSVGIKADQLTLGVEADVLRPVVTSSEEKGLPNEISAGADNEIRTKEAIPTSEETAKEIFRPSPSPVEPQGWLAPVIKCGRWIRLRLGRWF